MLLTINDFIKLVALGLLNSLPFIFLALYPFSDMFRFSKRITFLCICITYVLHLLNGYYYFISRNGIISNLLTGLLFCLAYFLAIKTSIYKILFVLFIVLNYCFSIIIGAKYIEHFLFPSISENIYSISYILTLFILLIVTYPLLLHFIGNKVKIIVHYSGNEFWWRYLFLIPAMFLIIYFCFFFHTNETYNYTNNIILFSILSIINIATYLFYFISFALVCELMKNQEFYSSLRNLTRKCSRSLSSSTQSRRGLILFPQNRID